ncbi:DUF6233 domain-containing protein [Streptomyces sp. NBC_00467]|uniref:DUF6233 domain-containing protein n=1 Tax=Streptomyces sp. NBC_00467 TaxID=2975752 RepID=UPI002E18481D
MSEPLPPPPPQPLELLYFLRRVQVQQLATTDRWIKEAETRQAALAARRPPPPPDWVLEHSGKDKTPMYVHAGPCNTRLRTRQVITAQEARRLITDGVRACVLCRPDTELGIIG